ncbi:MAG: hypothetical protein AB1529_00375 [Candidatus Micrarchaeota archaeon]
MGLLKMAEAALLMAGMKRNQWLSRDELEAIQGSRLRRLITHASSSVPYYRDAIGGADVRCIDDLPVLPLTEKNAVRNGSRSFISSLAGGRLSTLHTSGSTGRPLPLYFDSRDGFYGAVLRYHVMTELGFKPGDLLANMMVSRLQPFALQRFIYRVRDLNPSDADELNLAQLRRLAPDMLLTYPSKIVLLASLNLSSRERLGIRTVVSASELLSARTRELARSSFGCDLRNYYGMNESWGVGWECEKGSMHINSDSVIMEVVDKKGRQVKGGRQGELVLTSLWRYSMPFIRYRTGDMGAIGGSCACGRGLHVLKGLEGRSDDFLTLPSGRPFAAITLLSLLKKVPQMLQYQIVQEKDHTIRLLVVPEGAFTASDIKAIKRSFEEAIPEPVPIELEIVSELPRERSGKLRCVTSKLKPVLGT